MIQLLGHRHALPDLWRYRSEDPAVGGLSTTNGDSCSSSSLPAGTREGPVWMTDRTPLSWAEMSGWNVHWPVLPISQSNSSRSLRGNESSMRQYCIYPVNASAPVPDPVGDVL